MSSVTSALTRAGLASLALLIATFGIAVLAPEAIAEVKGNLMGIEDEGPADNYSRDCKADAIDPVGVLFRGSQASASNAAFETGRLTGWIYEGLGPQRLKVRAPGGGYVCNPVQAQPASEPDFRLAPPEVPQTRDHMRLWFIPATKNAEKRMTVGTPHREDFVEHDPTGISDHCTGLFSIPWGALDIAPGTHAVKKGGKGTEEVSGFDQARHALRAAFEKSPRHKVVPENWGNDELIEQCDEDFAGSDGVGLIIGLDGVNAGQTGRPNTRQSSALLRGRLLTTEEGSTDWWFEYGATPSQGAGNYPHKTAVKSISGNTEVDVNRAISALSPGTAYYVRMFARDEEGEVEEGNEVQFETCGWENTDEDDDSRGPRAATPECGGAVDTVYRDVNGDLGHQSWSAEGNWSTETRSASIARGATPRVFHRSDGSGVVDVFYRETDGDLGHQWWTPGSGWQAEMRSASMLSDPNVVTRPDGTIDVFYRTSGDELGHEWLVPGSGWSSETRSAVLSSDPHAVAHENGEMDVFYRSGSGLGRDHWAPEGGWSHEVRSGSLVAEPRPIAGENGAVDVFYRTAEDELGHDWFVPGTGWSRETRSESLASDPHVVRRPDGTIDVFYRTSGENSATIGGSRVPGGRLRPGRAICRQTPMSPLGRTARSRCSTAPAIA